MSNKSKSVSPTDALPLVLGFQPLSRTTSGNTMMIVRGRGVFLYDQEGRDYLDGSSSFYVTALGYSEPELIDAAMEQFHRLPFYVSATDRTAPVVLELAEKLAAIVPLKNARVAFATTGSEANDFLLKFLRLRNNLAGDPKRKKILARIQSYHGATLASASLTGSMEHHAEFDLPVIDVHHFPQPDYLNFSRDGETPDQFVDRQMADLEELLLREGPDTFAALLTEPVSFYGGLIIPPPTYFDKLQALLRKYGILFLADEVVTGFCRTGNFFACRTFGIQPNTIQLAKAITSGYQPLSAIVMDGDFADGLQRASDKAGMLFHAGTFAGHPVAAAVALKNLEIYERRNIPGHVAEVGPYFQSKLAAFSDYPMVAETRGVGLAGALEFGRDSGKENAPAPAAMAKRFYNFAEHHGLFVRATGPTIMLAPPLVITRQEVDILFDRFSAAMRDTLDWAAHEGKSA